MDYAWTQLVLVVRCTCGGEGLQWIFLHDLCLLRSFSILVVLSVMSFRQLRVCLLCLLFFVSQEIQAVEALMKWWKYLTMVLTVHT